MPDLAAKVRAALPANQTTGKNGDRARVLAALSTHVHFILYKFEYLRTDNGRVAIFNVKLGHLPFVHLWLLCQEVRGKGFLEQRVAPVFLIAQDRFNRAARPFCLSRRRGYTASCQDGRNLFSDLYGVPLPYCNSGIVFCLSYACFW